MEKHINEVLPGDQLGRDVISKHGLLLLRRSTKITQALKELLKKHSINYVWVL